MKITDTEEKRLLAEAEVREFAESYKQRFVVVKERPQNHWWNEVVGKIEVKSAYHDIPTSIIQTMVYHHLCYLVVSRQCPTKGHLVVQCMQELNQLGIESPQLEKIVCQYTEEVFVEPT